MTSARKERRGHLRTLQECTSFGSDGALGGFSGTDSSSLPHLASTLPPEHSLINHGSSVAPGTHGASPGPLPGTPGPSTSSLFSWGAPQYPSPDGFLKLLCTTVSLVPLPMLLLWPKPGTKNTLALATLNRGRLLFALLRTAGRARIGSWSRAGESVRLRFRLRGPQCGNPEEKWKVRGQVCWRQWRESWHRDMDDAALHECGPIA